MFIYFRLVSINKLRNFIHHNKIIKIWNFYNNIIMTKVVLGYWGIAGLAQPIRYLLAYSGINWE